MKKTVYILILVLAINGLMLSLLGRKSDYATERYLWRLNRQFAYLASDTQVIPDKKYADLAGKYEKFMKKFPNSPLAASAYMYLGRLYVLKRDYANARTVFHAVKEKYPDDQKLGTQALYETARTFVIEKDIPGALDVYHQVKRENPLSEIGLKVPLLIAVLYADNEDYQWSQKAFEEAIVYYNELIKKYPRTEVEYNVSNLLVKCYIAKNDWQSALDVMRNVLIRFPEEKYLTVQRAGDLIRAINGVAVGKLKDYQLAKGIYEEFTEKYPKHPLAPIMENMIAGIEQMQEEYTKSVLE